MADVIEVLDLLDLALARSESEIPEPAHAALRDTAMRIRIRDGFIGEVLVVALAGGTGSGKSSLLNALTESDLVTTGVVRPTTQHATAVYPPGTGADLQPLLDTLGVADRISDPSLDEIVVVDLPDFDSTAEAHRHVVESVLPTVDVVVWVLDPEKYADPVLHAEFLSGLSDYAGQFVFALNQVDRLGDDVDTVLEDLAAKLDADGFADANPLAITAAPFEGEPDIADLREAIADRLDTKHAAIAKIAIDARRVASTGYEACVSVDRSDLGEEDTIDLALSAATFVSLGVAAYEVFRRSTDRIER